MTAATRARSAGAGRVLLVCALLVVCALPPVLLIALLESKPAVERGGRTDIASAARAARLAGELRAALAAPDPARISEIRLTEQELNGMLALAGRGLQESAGRVEVGPTGVHGAFTFRLPAGPLPGGPYYVNVSGLLLASSSGIDIDYVRVGDLRLPGVTARWLLRRAAGWLLQGEGIGRELLGAVESVAVAGPELRLRLRPVAGLDRALERATVRARRVRDHLDPIARPEDVRACYEALCRLHGRIGGLVDVPLGYYLEHAFAVAGERSRSGGDAVAQNRAAILALAIFLGSPRFDAAVGALDGPTRQRCQPRSPRVVIAGRGDLRLHFLYSAALEVIGNSDVSFALGESKELLDVRRGGSGFSFTDLAADRAGIRLARLATSAGGAAKVQQRAADLTRESVYFPALDGLPDGLPRQELERRGGLDGEYYRRHLARIDRRMDDLPLYR